MIYCYPQFSRIDCFYFRFFGPGLGNLLFPWARAVLSARRRGHALIAPTWPQIKIGRLLRLDPDLRTYAGMFVPPDGAVTGLKRLLLLTSARRVQEDASASAKEGDVLVFEGMGDLFIELRGHHALILEMLEKSTRSSYLPPADSFGKGEIFVHVRLGDFAQATLEEISTGKLNCRIPMDWYVETVRKIRRVKGTDAKVRIFSDGSNVDLAPLLALPGCSMANYGSAIGDLIALSRASVLVASGSTFSMWASYLGQMPTIWHPGQLKQRVNSDARHEVEVGIQETMPSSIAELIRLG